MDYAKRVSAPPMNRNKITLLLIDKLSAGKMGDILTDEQLTQASGRDCSPAGDGYAYLASAIRFVLREHGLVWKRVMGTRAVECLDDKKKRGLAISHRDQIRHRAKRTCRILGTADLEHMAEPEKREHLAVMAQFGSLTLMSTDNTTKQLAARNVTEPITSTKLLDVFGGK